MAIKNINAEKIIVTTLTNEASPTSILSVSGVDIKTTETKTAFNKDYSTIATDIKVNGVQSLGVLDTLPRADHIHPIDTSREPANANIQSHISSTLNPHAVTKTQVGLGNVDNTTDLLKPISTATQDALNLKENVANKQNSLATDGTGTKYPTVDAIKATNIPAERLGASTFTSVQHIQDLFHSAGWTSGGVITNAGGGVITVSSGTGLIRATNSDIATIFFTDFAASIPANVVLVDGSQNYIYVEYNAGAPRVIATTIERADYNTSFLIGNVYRVGTTLHINSTTKTAISDHAGKMIAFNKEVMPYARANGSMISEVATRGFAITAGTFWNGLVRFTTNAFSTATGSFFYFYRNGVGGWTKVPTQTQINNTQYDNGTGTLATLSNNKYGIHWVFIDTDGDTYVVYGQGDYTLIDAQNEMIPASLPVEITSHGFVVGKIIIQKSLTTFAQIESAFTMGFSSAMASEHNSLAGLDTGNYLHLTEAQKTIAIQEATNILSGYVSAGTQTFGGEKTFTLSPIVPTPITPTQVSNKSYVDGKVTDIITDGVTTIAPSQNAVFDALALKEDKSNKNMVNGYAGLDENKKLDPQQLPDLAITKVFTATETTIALFAAASGNYTFEEGDVVIIINGADTKHYIFKGGAKTTVGNYSLLNSSQIDWSQLVSVPTTLSGYGITGTKAQFDTAVTDGNFMYIGDAPTAHTHLLSGITDVTMTVANLNSLDDGINSNLHFHDSDRARANHTGTQLSSTISDFTEATQDVIGGTLLDSTTIDLIYDDVSNTFSAQREALTGAITAPKNSNTTSLGTFTKAQLNTAISDGDALYVGDVTSNATHTGEVTGSTALTITEDAVTNAKLANMGVNTIKGRITAGTGDPEDLTATQVRTIITDADNRFVTDTEKGVWNAKQPQLNGTGFVKASGTTISYDNTSYQPLLTNPITGTLTTNKIPKASGTGTLTDSVISEVGGNVGIGTTTPDALLHLNTFGVAITIGDTGSTAKQLQIRYDNGNNYAVFQALHQNTGYKPILLNPDGGNVLIGTTTDNGAKLQVNGSATFAGSVTATDFIGSSDITLKENIQALQPKKINSNYKTFNFIGSEQQRVGVIAQELEIEHPEFVRTDDNGIKSVSYTDLHSAEIAYLKDKIEKLEELVNKLIG